MAFRSPDNSKICFYALPVFLSFPVVVCSCILSGSPFVALLLCVQCCLQSFSDVRNTCTTPDGLPTDAPKFLDMDFQTVPKFLEPTEIFMKKGASVIFRRTGIFIFVLPIEIFRYTRNFYFLFPYRNFWITNGNF